MTMADFVDLACLLPDLTLVTSGRDGVDETK